MQDLIAALADRAAQTPERRAFVWIEPGAEARTLTDGELFARARSIAAQLQARPPGDDLVLLLYPPGLEFLAGFFGTLLAGKIAVPANLPDTSRAGRGLARLRSILDDTGARLILTTRETAPELRALDVLDGRAVIATDELAATDDRWQRPSTTAETVAYLQYTSGSTSAAKGVIITHGNLVRQAQFLAAHSGFSRDTVGVTWVPPYHDQGLIYGICEPMLHGHLSVLMSPQTFAMRPGTWLRAISEYRATHAGGPNFGYELCVRKVREAERAGLDLSSWQLAYNAAEPVRAATLARFADAFAPTGFSPRAFQAAYGLAEATLRVAGSPFGGGVTVTELDADALARGVAVPARDGHAAVALCGHGPVDRPQRSIKIVDATTEAECPPGRLGEIWVAGPDVASGYWRRPPGTDRAFGGTLAEVARLPRA